MFQWRANARMRFCANTLGKHAYSNILKISPPKTDSFQIKILILSYFCSKHRLWVLVRTEYPQPMFSSRNAKTNVYPYKPQFHYIKVGFKGVKIIGMFSRWMLRNQSAFIVCRLTQSERCEALNFGIFGSNPTVGGFFLLLFYIFGHFCH